MSQSESEVKVPDCVGFIMDGNRRWAKAKGLPSLEGHRAGLERVKPLIRHAHKRGVSTVILYAFSTENWNRAPEEVSYFMKLLESALSKEVEEIMAEGVRIRFIGELERLPQNLREAVEQLERDSAGNTRGTLAIALSYGGRAEIVAAVNSLLEEGRESVGEADISGALWTAGIPDPDLIVRTSGEKRLSGFLPWQGIYSELFFTDTYWPDFSEAELDTILAEYASRERRRGK